LTTPRSLNPCSSLQASREKDKSFYLSEQNTIHI
jgi:hypothetical protein